MQLYRNIFAVRGSSYGFAGKNGRKIFIVMLLLVVLPYSCQTRQHKADTHIPSLSGYFSLSTFQLENGKGYGYEILKNERVFIHQEFIPALEGEQFFKSREDAMKIGNEVLKKIQNNKPPGITKEEVLRLLGNYKM